MRLETLLPLGNADPGLQMPDTPIDLTSVANNTQVVESLGNTGMKQRWGNKIFRYGRGKPNIKAFPVETRKS